MKYLIKLTVLSFLLLLILIAPFLILGFSIENWTSNFLSSTSSPWLIFVTVGGLLSIDILAPIPSSIVSTSGGYLLGFIPGTIISWTGMTVSCIFGYYLGSTLGSTLSEKIVGNEEHMKLEKIQNRFGDWIVVIFRSVPVLGEASILIAGMGHMPWKRFMGLILLANLGI